MKFETFAEALAALRAELEPGAIIILHDEDCALGEDDADDSTQCTCEPVLVTRTDVAQA